MSRLLNKFLFWPVPMPNYLDDSDWPLTDGLKFPQIHHFRRQLVPSAKDRKLVDAAA